MNKRLIGGIAAAGIIGGGVYGFAATLDIESDTVSANSADVGNCDPSGVDVDYTVVWGTDTDPDSYIIDKVTVSDISHVCDGDAIKVTLLQGATNNEQVGTVAEDATDVDTDEEFDFSGDAVSAELLDTIHVVIAG